MRRAQTVAILAILMLAAPAAAQSTTPAMPTIPSTSSSAGATTAPAAPATFWGSVSTCCASAKKAISNGPLCKLLKAALGPLSALTGGAVPGTLPPGAAALAAPGSVGAAAKIQADQAAAKERMLAVRFLGTIDCHWYPEAEAALVAALRADRSECVRFEAAKSLARGCCCTKTTIEALAMCVSGSDKDGNPSENSLRVQLVALEGLQRCVTSYRGEAEGALPRPEAPASGTSELAQAGPATDLPPIHLSAYYASVKRASKDDVIANAKKVVAMTRTREVAVPENTSGRRSLYEIWQRAQ